MLYPTPSTRLTRRRRPGFTLIEAAMTTMIIGIGCVSMLALLGQGTLANNEGTELTTAMNLAGNVREAMAGLSYSDPKVPSHWGPELSGPGPIEDNVTKYNDYDDFDGKKFSPPINANRLSLGANYATWEQQVAVQTVNPTDLNTAVSHLTLPPAMRPTCRCTVTVLHNGKVIYAQTWVAAYADPSAP
jgi:type II secretory pathway pseudopilin PulG